LRKQKKCKKSFAGLKNGYIFAASQTKGYLLTIARRSYFYGYTLAVICKDTRLSNHCWLRQKWCNFSWSRCGAIAFFIFINLQFHSTMTRRNENYSRANNSNSIVALAHETRKSLYFKHVTELNAKNKAHAFILENGWIDDFEAFCNFQKI